MVAGIRPNFVDFDDYRQKYGDDGPGMEMGPDARVCRVYNDEADKYDKEMLDGWHESLNILLTFVSQTQALQLVNDAFH